MSAGLIRTTVRTWASPVEFTAMARDAAVVVGQLAQGVDIVLAKGEVEGLHASTQVGRHLLDDGCPGGPTLGHDSLDPRAVVAGYEHVAAHVALLRCRHGYEPCLNRLARLTPPVEVRTGCVVTTPKHVSSHAEKTTRGDEGG